MASDRKALESVNCAPSRELMGRRTITVAMRANPNYRSPGPRGGGPGRADGSPDRLANRVSKRRGGAADQA